MGSTKVLRINNYFQYWQQYYNTINIRMINNIRLNSGGSCDTEDWSNDAENSALITGINYILKYINISYFEL